MRMPMIFTLLLSTAASQAADAPLPAEHEKLVKAAIEALCEEARVLPGQIQRRDETRDGRARTTLETPYTSWPNLAARAEVTVTSKGAAPELKAKVTTGNLVWTRHKSLDERIESLARRKAAGLKLNDTRPTELPAAPLPKAKELPVQGQPAPKK